MTMFAMLVKPWAMLLFFALVVIPIRLITLRLVPRSWHPLLLSEVPTWQQALVMAATVITIGLLAIQ